MQKTKKANLALILLATVFCTVSTAQTVGLTDEEIVTQAVKSILQVIQESKAVPQTDKTLTNEISSTDNATEKNLTQIQNLDPSARQAAESLLEIEKILQKKNSENSNSLEASLLGLPKGDTTTENSSSTTPKSSESETISRTDDNEAVSPIDAETKAKTKPIYPTLLRSSTEPLMQFSRRFSRTAISLANIQSANANLKKDPSVQSTRVAAERYHRVASTDTSILSTENLTTLGVTLAFALLGVLLYFLHSEKKLLKKNIKFKNLNYLQSIKKNK